MSPLHEEESSRSFVISLSDLLQIVRSHWRKVALGACLGACLFFLYAVTRVPTYPAKASFHDRPPQYSGLSGASGMLIGLSDGGQVTGQTMSVLRSRTLLKAPIRSLGLQAQITPFKKNPNRLLPRIYRNIRIELLSLMGRRRLPISDPTPFLVCREVQFDNENPNGAILHFLSDKEFEVMQGKDSLGIGYLGEPFYGSDFSFTLYQQDETPLIGKRFALGFIPLEEVVTQLNRQIALVLDKDNPRLIHLLVNHPSRHFGSDLLNAILTSYETHLEIENRERTERQLTYLEERQEETLTKLRQFMAENAADLSDSLNSGQFLNLNNEVSFLTSTQAQYEQKLLDINLELKFLNSLGTDNTTFCEGYLHSDAVNQLVSQIHRNRQQRDSLDFALKRSRENCDQANEISLERQLEELKRLQHRTEEIQILMACVEGAKPVPEGLDIVRDPNSLTASWINSLASGKPVTPHYEDSPSETFASLEQDRGNLQAYLRNLLHTTQVRTKVIRDHLNGQREEEEQFQGIDIHTCNTLYLNYTQHLDSSDSQICQLQHALTQLDNPDFELSSLTATLDDAVSTDMIREAGASFLQLQDAKNRSLRDQERIRDRLNHQRSFLALHIQQLIEMVEQQNHLIRERMRKLQEIMLDRYHQEVSILEGELNSYVTARKQALKHEKILFEQQLKDLQNRAAFLPEKWLAEQEMQLCMDMGVGMVRGITELVESKNISHNLNLIESEVLDSAVPATIPNPPRLLLFTFLGALVGGGLTLVSIGTRAVLHGIPASPVNLQAMGCKVAGILSESYESDKEPNGKDLEVLRQIWTHFEKRDAPITLLINNGAKGIGASLAKLHQLRGSRVLLVDCSLAELSESNSSSAGLLQYLEGLNDFPQVTRRKEYDFLPTGGVSKYQVELLSSVRLGDLLTWARENYDQVLLTTSSSPLSSESQLLMQRCEGVAISLCGETLHDLRPMIEAWDEKSLLFYFREGELRP